MPAAPPPAPAPAPAPPPAPGPGANLAGIRVAVYNATAEQGAARGVGDELEARRAEVAVFGGVPSQPGGRTIVRYVAGAEAKARRVAAVLGVPGVERYDPATAEHGNPPESARAAVIVLVGYDRTTVTAPRTAGYPSSIACWVTPGPARTHGRPARTPRSTACTRGFSLATPRSEETTPTSRKRARTRMPSHSRRSGPWSSCRNPSCSWSRSPTTTSSAPSRNQDLGVRLVAGHGARHPR